ncbi:MAG: hypothetical protein INR66_22325 [Gordonia polyisoprenivorans]|nr:hypothetical protein [Gordonia polyisoprenivorans]
MIKIDRFNSCSRRSLTLLIYQIINGSRTVTGSADLTKYDRAYTVATQSRWSLITTYTITAVRGTASGATLTAEKRCSSQTGNGCKVVETSGSGGSVTPGRAYTFETIYEYPSPPAGTVDKSFASHIVIAKYQTAVASEFDDRLPDARGSGYIRCDNALPGRGAGCVVYGTTPYIEYSNAKLPEFVAHIVQAQASGLPSILSRTTDTALSTANGAKACPSSWPRPQTPYVKSCDEYPLRSTQQGAATVSGGKGPARTFPGCEVPLPTGLSASFGYSACMIRASENSTAGSALLSVLYNPHRIINGDSFEVRTAP